MATARAMQAVIQAYAAAPNKDGFMSYTELTMAGITARYNGDTMQLIVPSSMAAVNGMKRGMTSSTVHSLSGQKQEHMSKYHINITMKTLRARAEHQERNRLLNANVHDVANDVAGKIVLQIGDPYKQIGVPVSVTEEQTRDAYAYRKMALRFHPDKNDSPKAQAVFTAVRNAYETVLHDIVTRERASLAVSVK